MAAHVVWCVRRLWATIRILRGHATNSIVGRIWSTTVRHLIMRRHLTNIVVAVAINRWGTTVWLTMFLFDHLGAITIIIIIIDKIITIIINI